MNILINPLFVGIIQTLLSVVVLSGFLFFGRIINSNFFKNYQNILFDFLISIIIFSQILKIFSYLEFFKQINLILSISIIIFGLYNFVYIYNFLRIIKFKFPKNLFETIIFLFIFLLFIISISPPSMADALDYHYGIPLYLLKFNELPDPYLWIHGTLANNGEIINALALYVGTDNFGSLIQFFALLLFIFFLSEKVQDKKKLIFLIIFIICSPTLLQLISGPKFLLFPQILTASALLILIDKNKININDFIFICLLLIGASQFKLSFVLSVTILGLFLLFKAFENNKTYLILSVVVLFILFFSPTMLWNFYNLNDFDIQNLVSPIPIETIKSFQNYRENNFFYPLNLLIPNSIGSVTSILGFQFLTLFFIYKNQKETNLILLILFSTIALHFFLSLNISRIYYEFILWTSVGIYFSQNKNVNYSMLSKIIYPQLIIVFIFASYFSMSSIPALISNDYRDKFMKNNSHEYSSIKWINEVLPRDEIIISDLRSVAFYNHDFIPTDWLKYNIPKKRLNEYLNLINNKKAKYIVLRNNNKNNLLNDCIGDKYLESPEFIQSTRNPFNRKNKYSISIYKFNYKNIDNCVK